jgi:hypothetical protein
MASPKSNIETNEKPLDKITLDELIRYSGYDVHMIMQYVLDDENKGMFLIYAKYHNSQITRQVYTQRNKPRSFRDAQRAIEWGKRIGFKSAMIMPIDYGNYPEPDSND